MSMLFLIIKREFISKIRNKSFIIMTFLSPLFFVALSLVISYLSNQKTDQKKIAIHTTSKVIANSFLKENASSSNYQFDTISKIPIQFAKDSLLNSYEGIVYITTEKNNKNLKNYFQYISNNSPSSTLIKDIESVIEQDITKINLIKKGIDTLAIKNAQADISITIIKPSGEKNIKGLNEIKIAIGGAFGYLVMMFIVLYGNMVLRSVIEEKSNRIIEIIISSVKPIQLMLGKIFGTSLAGLLQFAIWVLLGFGLLFFISFVIDVPTNNTLIASKLDFNKNAAVISEIKMYVTELWKLPIAQILVGFAVYFLGGFFLYSSIYAAIGAAVDSQTDSQQFLFPVIMPLVLSVYIGFFSVANNPHSLTAVVFSVVPLTSPIVMLMRLPFGVPLWQIALSVTILFGSFWLVVVFAAKIYRIGILMHGQKATWKQLYQWMKM